MYVEKNTQNSIPQKKNAVGLKEGAKQ